MIEILLKFYRLHPITNYKKTRDADCIQRSIQVRLLTQNSKMRKSSLDGLTVVNWTIPAFQSVTGLRTCPNAGLCAVGCYARSGTYRFGNVASAHEAKLELTQTDEFVPMMILEIESWLRRRSVSMLKIRIHDSGDFYSLEYFNKWIRIMSYFGTDERVTFYAYSKQVKMIKEYGNLPTSFRVIYSFGGKEDRYIDTDNDFHSMVFESVVELGVAGYSDGTHDDLVAAVGNNKKIGLVYHGQKSYGNTGWGKVS